MSRTRHGGQQWTRRSFVAASAALGGALVASGVLTVWAKGGRAANLAGRSEISGTTFDLSIGRAQVRIDGQSGPAIAVNGQVPAPLLRWREGDEITINVHNSLDEITSIHWHGLLVPFQMDGVPGVSFPGIRPGETFTYHFPIHQAGTYWYHSHSGLQEQLGHYGPIVIEPRRPDPVAYDREHVIVLSDYTYEGPDRLFAKLMKMSDTYNFQRRTVTDFFGDLSRKGMGSTVRDRLRWGRMRMSPTDISDVTGAALNFLVNGHASEDNWTGLFVPGERVRLRFINASASTIFNVRVPALPMTVVQTDGLNVQPVETDEFQIGPAEIYDMVVQPQENCAFTLMCETIDRSGYVRATLAPQMDMAAAVPDLRPRPIATMRDMAMGMGMSDMAMGKGAMGQGSHTVMQAHNHPGGVGVANTARQPVNRLSEPGAGLTDVGHRVLVYTDLKSLDPNPDIRLPEREIEVHLTGNMERYMWSFDGRRYSEGVDPIELIEGERFD